MSPRDIRVLVACEYSATVRDAFRKRGFDAWSCDILPTEGDPRWHLQGDVRDFIKSHNSYGQRTPDWMSWDLIVAHPPCQFLTYAGAAYWNDEGRAEKREEAMRLFMDIYHGAAPHVAIENPRGYPSKVFRSPDQEVNPFDFGQPIRKRVCLWLRDLPKLIPTDAVPVSPDKVYIRKTGARAGQPYRTYFHQGKSAKERARFFPCIADAMAQQWGEFMLKK